MDEQYPDKKGAAISNHFHFFSFYFQLGLINKIDF